MPRLTSVERERAVGMLQSGLRAADVDRCVMCRTRQYCADASSPGDWDYKGLSTQWPRWHRNEISASRTCEIGRGQPIKLLLRHQGVIMPEYLLKSCVIVSGDLARVLNARIEALSWQSPGVLQGSIGVPGNANRFSSLMSPGLVSLRVRGSEYGIAEVNTLPMPLLLNRTVRVAGCDGLG